MHLLLAPQKAFTPLLQWHSSCKHTLMCKIGEFKHAILNLSDLTLWALDKKADVFGLNIDFLLFALLVALLVQN